MAVLERLVRTARAWRGSLSGPIAMDPLRSRARVFRHRSYRRTFEQNDAVVEEFWRSYNTRNGFRCVSTMTPAVVGSLFSVGAVGLAYAEADEADGKPSSPKDSTANYVDMAKKERARIEELLRSKEMHHGSIPRFNVAIKGQKTTIKFQIPPTCEVAQLIANVGSQLGVKVAERPSGSDMILRAWDSSVAWQLTLRSPQNKKELGGIEDDSDEDLCILIFGSLISSDKPEIEFIKKGRFTDAELEAFVSALQLAGTKVGHKKGMETKPDGDRPRAPPADKSISQLESMGVRIYGVNESLENSSNEITWDTIAGYHQQKREIEDTILMSLHSPEVYDDIVRGTRSKFESNRPRAVLFEGPPGTGKTSCARVIATQAGIPLLYVPLEAVMSKYYGESERLLGTVFSLANELSDGAIIFLDEIDAFAVLRDTEIHEATRRVLSVLLRQIDGFEQDKKVVVIAATNRKQDLDPALISRFDSIITFGLPDFQTRQEIITQYAKQLTKSELVQLAQATEGMSGRDIRDVCQRAERTWASKLIRGQARKADGGKEVSLPPLQEYLESAEARHKALLSVKEQRDGSISSRSRKPLLDFN
ncbi:PREDICTED: uncharacterized protein LOC104813427 [Tarenaya hassleriana]|uniref:uncharacterized protein LOC104813427 n=1 Tax=Tarenaya hassleriana TaxID=28532 RepID=UPI00053C32DA|nr:PREDICTED: uncharacterized protein LOC104813427 [Tarenaya hassleriana]XP_010539316.1 PREDICTED: uncharacterized protein LOC104813427 [Tarenaya hassleriana]